MRVPADVEISVSMTAENWAFGSVKGVVRENASTLSPRPAGTEKPVTTP